MTEFLSSAFGYFSNLSTNNSNGASLNGIIEIGTVKLRIKKVIAEGGFSTILAAQAIDSGKIYALKRILAADDEANRTVRQEIEVSKKLSGHPNIIKFLSASVIDKAQAVHNQYEYMILMELCSDGTLVDLVSPKSVVLSPELVCKLFYQVCLAVKHLHQQNPPVIHRDLKLENFLLGEDGKIKLCDFGSVTMEVVSPDENWSAQRRALLEDSLAQFTTPMYRAPEMVDTWSNYEINKATDIWALGCILYSLCFKKHPFEDSAKLAIVNANFTIPPADLKFKNFHSLIRGCLKANPQNRIDINELLERLASIAETNNFGLNEPLDNWNTIIANHTVVELDTEIDAPGDNLSCEKQSSHVLPPSRPPPPTSLSVGSSVFKNEAASRRQPTDYATSSSASGLFSQLKGGAGSLFKNLKDTSSKVVQSVQSSMARSGVDITYLTSRLAVMSYPGEGLEMTTSSNCAENVRALLESKHHGTRYSVYNVSRRSYPTNRIGRGRLVDCGWSTLRRTPALHALYAVCQDMYKYLVKDKLNVCIVHCLDGKSSSAVLVSAFLMFVRFVSKPEDAAQLFAVKRIPPTLYPSEIRYLKYFSQVVTQSPFIPHFHPMKLVSVTMHPVPLFNKSRDGCRPYIEVYQGDLRIFSTQQDYDKMMLFHISHGKVRTRRTSSTALVANVVLPLNISVVSDVTISVYHARHVLGRPTGIKILQYQFHTGFLSTDIKSIICTKKDLDDLSEGEYYQSDNFTMTIAIESLESVQPYPILWDNEPVNKYSPEVLFSSKLEADEMTDAFATKKRISSSRKTSIPVRAAPPRPPPPSAEASPIHSKEPSPKEQIPLESQVDLLNLSYSSLASDQLAQANLEADFLNLTAEDSEQPSRSNLLDIPDDKNISVSIPLTSSKIEHNVKSSPVSFDLLGDLGMFTSESTPAASDSATANRKKFNDMFDPFSMESFESRDTLFTSTNPTANPSLGNTTTVNSFATNLNLTPMQRNISTPNLSADLFGNLDLIDKSGGTSGTCLSPEHRPNSKTSSHFSSTPMSPVGSPVKQPGFRSPCEPNYSRSHFDNVIKMDAGKPTARSKEDIFGDLLGSQGYSFSSSKNASGPRTINEMRKVEMVKEMDPDKMKVLGWVEGKKGNIRALLCSMHTILWDGATWHCKMHQMVTAADVKKAYRKACLAVHPDKQIGTANESLAKLIFVELNNAWSDFENDASQQNMFR